MSSTKRFPFDEGKDSSGDSPEPDGKSTKVILKSVADDKERKISSPTRNNNMKLDRDALADEKLPDLDPGAPVKQRLSAIEGLTDVQRKKNELIDHIFEDIDTDISKLEAVMERSVAQLQEKVYNDFAEMRKVYEQRYELQIAENSRTQQHISGLKSENNQLRRKLLILTEKVHMLQDEFGTDDPGLEDEAIALKLGIMNISPNNTGAFRSSTA